MRLAWERFRARRKPGTAMAASKAMMATTIMISTRVKPVRRDLRFIFIVMEIKQPLCQVYRSPIHYFPDERAADFFWLGRKIMFR